MTARLALLTFVTTLTLGLTACEPVSRNDTADTAAATTGQPASASTHKPASAATRWRCGELPVSTYFDDDSLESITLRTPERQLTLKSMVNDEGARFADAGGNEFWSRPGKVTFTQVGQPTRECTKVRS